MSIETTSTPETLDNQRALTPSPITSVQPGGGFCMALELAWGRLRRWYLRTFRTGYVRRMAERRQGQCPDCPHDVIDPRDLKFYRNVCGYWFKPEDDRFAWRGRLGFARAGLCELVLVNLLTVVVLAGIGAGVWLGLSWWIAGPLLLAVGLIWLELVTFFRDPERVIPAGAEADLLVSPADGTVTDVGEFEELDFPGGRAFRVGIFLSIFSVHVNRAPRTGRVVQVQYFPGKFLNALYLESLKVNEQLWVDLVETSGRRVRIKQVAGAIARRIVCWLKPGDEVRAGERYGMIKYGSRTEVYVPFEEGIEAIVRPGDKVKGGITVLLRLASERRSTEPAASESDAAG